MLHKELLHYHSLVEGHDNKLEEKQVELDTSLQKNQHLQSMVQVFVSNEEKYMSEINNLENYIATLKQLLDKNQTQLNLTNNTLHETQVY